MQGAARPSGASFGPPQNVSGPGASIFDPTVGIGRNGSALAVWSGLSGSSPAVQGTVRPKGGAFGAVIDLDIGDGATGRRGDGVHNTGAAGLRQCGERGIGLAPLDGHRVSDPRLGV